MANHQETSTVHTVLGPIPSERLGITLAAEQLLRVVPGAQYAFDVVIDRAEVFDAIAARLVAFRERGGQSVVDAGGMFAGRDLPLYEALSRETGVHIIASTGQGAEDQLGGYFLTPQTNPPTPWPAERFAELYSAEATAGMVVPRVERRQAAGLVSVAVTASGATPTDASQLRGAARAAHASGVPLLVSAGADPIAELGIALEAGLAADRIAVAGAGSNAAALVERGASVVLTDPVDPLVTASPERVLLSTGTAVRSFGEAAPVADYAELLDRTPAELHEQLFAVNPLAFFAVKGA